MVLFAAATTDLRAMEFIMGQQLKGECNNNFCVLWGRRGSLLGLVLSGIVYSAVAIIVGSV